MYIIKCTRRKILQLCFRICDDDKRKRFLQFIFILIECKKANGATLKVSERYFDLKLEQGEVWVWLAGARVGVEFNKTHMEPMSQTNFRVA